MSKSSLWHLQKSLARIDTLIRVAVERAQSTGQDPTNALRGLLISTDEVESYLDQPALTGLWSHDHHFTPTTSLIEPEAHGTPFAHLVRVFNLSELDSYILLLSLAPELDRRYERLYAYLQDDISQRYATVSLMMNLLGGDVDQRFAVWQRLALHSPLRTHHLIDCRPDNSRTNSPFLSYQIKADHRIVSYLLGDMHPDERLEQSTRLFPVPEAITVDDPRLDAVHGVLSQNPMLYIQGVDNHRQYEIAALLCAAYDTPLVITDVATLADLDLPFVQAWRLALREAYLRNAALLLDHWEVVLREIGQPPTELWQALLEYPLPVFICGAGEWEPLDRQRQRRLLRLDFSIPDYPERLNMWVNSSQSSAVTIPEHLMEELASKFRFTHSQIARAIQTAADLALTRGEAVSRNDLYAGAQAHASLKMGHLAKRILPRYYWEDLILPPDQLSQLREISDRARYGHIVQSEWGFGNRASNGYGISALFAGDSGTGKTLAAEVIANSLGLVLYKIDLSAVVSKYIGETEKNLGAIFKEARSSNAILFFDEADALFGKRSEVKDARDRYANIEISYLLQEIEAYDGIAILATNLRQNLDDAFTRRLDFLIDFPFPESQYRRHIWAVHFPPEAPLSAEVDLDEVAERYHLAGGNIRNATLAAAYLAAADGGVITRAHIRNAVRREHQKMGRLLNDND